MPDLRIAAVDLSLTSTGIARWDPSEAPEPITCVVTCPMPSPITRIDSIRRLCVMRDEILGLLGPVHFVAVEGYAPDRKYAREALGELAGVVLLALYEHGIPFAIVGTSQLKVYATGKGNSAKMLVYQAAIRRGQRDFATLDEADAWWLLQMALARYGLPHVPMPAANRSVLDKIAWPALEALEVPA